MAVVKTLTVGSPTGRVHPTHVDCEVRRVIAADGSILVQISTFGSENRVSDAKVSQTLQFDRSIAMQLRAIIEEIFPSVE